MNDPPRSTDDPDAPRALARLVRGARADGPSEAELAALTAAVRARVGSGSPGGGGAPPLRPRTRWITRALPVAVVGAAALLLTRVERPAPAPRAPVAARAPARTLPPAPPPSPPPVALPAPAAAPVAPPPTPRDALVAVAAPAPSACDPGEHLRAVESARRSLRDGQPQASLGLLARDRRACPRGPLAEERDRVEIESLLALNRRAEASRRLARFAQEHPGSLHLLALRARMDSGVGSAVASEP